MHLPVLFDPVLKNPPAGLFILNPHRMLQPSLQRPWHICVCQSWLSPLLLHAIHEQRQSIHIHNCLSILGCLIVRGLFCKPYGASPRKVVRGQQYLLPSTSCKRISCILSTNISDVLSIGTSIMDDIYLHKIVELRQCPLTQIEWVLRALLRTTN